MAQPLWQNLERTKESLVIHLDYNLQQQEKQYANKEIFFFPELFFKIRWKKEKLDIEIVVNCLRCITSVTHLQNIFSCISTYFVLM